MKPVFVPNYYKDFACIASACRHCCCIGWEIDVDGESLARYGTVQGDVGDRLRQHIDYEADPPCFILTEDERCPFLREDGLCDLICELGEGSLCHICADHPRFRHVMDDRVELGLGLCCEAAARLILSQTEPLSLVELPPEEAARERYAHEKAEPTDNATQELLRLRAVLLTVLADSSRPLPERIRSMLAIAGAQGTACETASFGRYASIAALLRDMERLDPAWDACLDALEALPDSPLLELEGETDRAYENLLGYFLYRYMTADDPFLPASPAVRTAFAVLSTVIIHAVHRATGGKNLDSLCEIARMFSCEMEYSEENLERMMEEIVEGVIGL